MNTQTEAQDQVTPELGVRDKVLEIIEKVYECCFAGNLRVIPLKTVGWQVEIGLPNIEKPFVLAAELPLDEFLKYLEKELRFSSWDYTEHYKVELNYSTLEKPNI